MKSLAKGKAGKPIDVPELKRTTHTFRQTPQQAAMNREDMLKINEILLEKKTKKKLRALLKKRGWSAEDINGAMQELWPETN
jgi:SOS response regulatory protein OraA/RecX